MPFIPLQSSTPASFPRISPEVQTERDEAAEQLVRDEFDEDMPDDSRAALETEYRHRFKKEPPKVVRGFIPLETGTEPVSHGFVPIKAEHPGILKTVALENPLTAAGETALNLGSQAIALPAAGIAGLATEAGNLLGLTEKRGADVVHSVGDALTYQPRGEMGRQATEIATYPFQKLAEAGQYAGSKTLDATGSPLAATAVETAINALPMAISPAKRGVMAARERMAGKSTVEEVARIEPTIAEPTPRGFIPEAEPALREGFTPITEAVHEGAATTHKTILVDSPDTLRHQAADQATAALPKAASVDEAVALFETALERPVAPPSKVAVDVPMELQPGRFSGKTFGDDLLESLKHEASPELLEEIGREQQRRGVLAESLANDHAGQAMLSGNLASQQAMMPGANYVPLIDDARLTGTVERRTEPLRREDVLIPLIKALDTTIYEGRIKQKKVLGLYTPGKETVRIKRSGDIEVAAHEIAHLLDDRIPEIRDSWALGPERKTYAAELKGVSYDKKNVKEGFAEFVRLYMTQPEQARAKAPYFSQWFDDFTGRHEYGKAIKQAQTDMTGWYGQNAIDRARSKIGMRRNFNEAFDGLWDKFRQSTVDDLHGIYRMERDLKGEIKAGGGAYESARLSRASHSIAEGAINFGHPVKKADGSFSYQGKCQRRFKIDTDFLRAAI